MADMEQVAKALDCCLDRVRSGLWASGCIQCPYAKKEKCIETMITDARDLLQMQLDRRDDAT